MLLVCKTSLIEGQVFPKLVFHHKIGIEKQFDGVVNSGTADLVFFLFENFEMKSGRTSTKIGV